MATNRKNLATGLIGTAINTSATTLVLQSGYGAAMPNVPFFLTLTPAGQLSTLGNSEVVEVTARSSDSLTIVRARKGTTAKSFAVGDVVGNGVYTEDTIGPENINTTYQTGVPASLAIPTNGWVTCVTITLPTTPVPHRYLILNSMEFANASGGAANEFATRFLNGASTQFAIVYHDCHAGTYFTSSTLNGVIVSSGENVYIQGYSQAASRATNSRGNWICLDMGVA